MILWHDSDDQSEFGTQDCDNPLEYKAVAPVLRPLFWNTEYWSQSMAIENLLDYLDIWKFILHIGDMEYWYDVMKKESWGRTLWSA